MNKKLVIDGFNCEIRQLDDEHLCGYVEIPHDHCLYGVGYYDDRFPRLLVVHGGVTYAGFASSKRWLLGFDCGHTYKMRDGRRPGDPNYRDEEYVTNELKKFVDQLKRVKKRTRVEEYFEVEG